MRSLACSFALISTLLTGCSSGNSEGTGALTLALTDAASEELDMFEVDVTNVTLTKLSGNTVSVLTRATRVDFAELVDIYELIVGFGAEVGLYTHMNLTLDFTNAVVCLKDQTTAATVLDKDGAPITGTVDVQVNFAVGARPVVSLSRNHMLVLDLDLNQAVTVDTAANTVTFSPVISAINDPTDPKPMAATGLLSTVDQAASNFMLEKRAVDNSTIGTYPVQVSGLTVFQIDGIVSTGATGLMNLGALAPGTRVWVQGALDPLQQVLHAVAVESGAGVPGNGQDFVIGHVFQRTNGAGNDTSISVIGRSLDVSSSTRTFNTVHTVDLMLGSTRVLRRGAGNSLTTDDINVGQLVMVFGTLSGTNLDATAATGVARMLQTRAYGIATGPAAGNTLTLNMTRFGLRGISAPNAFDFMVGGLTEADPTMYTIDVTGLDTTGIVAGSKICAHGFANIVGNPADDDFQAISLVDRTNTARLMLLQWSPATTAAVTGTTATTISLDVNGTALSVVADGFANVPVNTTPTPTIQPLTILGIYRIVEGPAVELHLGFGQFASSLQQRVTLGSSVFRIAALGTYDTTTQVFNALAVSVILD